nr:hypothetical protein CFP56_59543 [Quercus suber]
MERLVLPPTVEDVEALACRRAISFALEIGLQEVMFEGDLDTIIRSLNAEPPSMVPFGHIIEDACSIASSLRYHSFSHVKHSGNCVVDKLAKLAKYCNGTQIWMEDIHREAHNLVLFDQSLVI